MNNRTLIALLSIILIVLLAACSEQLSNEDSNSGTISQATWNPNTGQLLVAGSTITPRGKVVIADADSDNPIGQATAESGNWLTISTSAICNVRVTFNDGSTKTKAIENAPSACQQLSSNSRILRAIVLSNSVEPVFNAPNGIITSPQSNTIIDVGDSIRFAATATDPLGQSPIKYIWDFAGTLPNSLAQNPGEVTFKNAGSYKITLTTINNNGIPDPSPATKLIVVNANNSNQTATPIANILSPANATTVFVGDSLTFLGEGSGPGTQNPAELIYTWNFDSSITQPEANIQAQSPGTVAFLNAGQFTIQLNVQNAAGMQSTLPAEVSINVLPVNANLPPIGIIDSPPLDVVITAGERLFFSAAGADVNGSSNLSYNWDFGRLTTANQQQQTPGLVTFNHPGIFTVGLSVTDPQGLSAPIDASRVVTVVAADSNTPLAAKNTILSPPNNISILIGGSATFTGQVTTDDPNAAVEPLSYLWTFDGAAADSTELNPGDITFSVAGKFNVEFTVINANGVKVGKTAKRKIQVKNLTATITNPAVEETIINLGETIDFTGAYEVLDLAPNQTISFLWEFTDGIAPNSTEQNAGPITFNTFGKFDVKFSVIITDAAGIEIDQTDVEVKILVVDPNAPLPTATITNPAIKKNTINVGETIDFTGEFDVFNLAPDQTASFLWEFTDAITPNSTEQNADPVTFNTPGKFDVKFSVIITDAVDIEIDRATEKVKILVVDPNAPLPLRGKPNGILNPTENLIIEAGSTVTFEGEGIDIGTTGQATYLWKFSPKGAAKQATPIPDITEQNPAPIIFDQLGEYRVKYNADGIDANGQKVKIKGDRRIMVISPGTLPAPPIPPENPANAITTVTGTIISPISDMTIQVGQSVNFAAEGRSPNGGSVTFVWNFSGATPNSTTQNPGIVTFNRTGIFTINLIVTNAAGERDPNPSSITISVTDANGSI